MTTYGTTVSQLRQVFEGRDNPQMLNDLGNVNGILEKLKVNPKEGVKQADVADRQRVFGENRIPEKPAQTYMQILIGAFQDLTIIMLICAAVASLIVCFAFEIPEHPDSLCWIEGTAIIGTVILVTNVAALQDYQKEQQFRRLNAEVENITTNVVRDGQRIAVSRYDLVVGDIVRLSIGDILEGDGVLVEGFDVEADESALTGEPILIKKNPDAPFLLSGSSIQKGQGTYVLIAVGVNSEKGRIQALVRGHNVALATVETDDGEKKEAEEKKEEEEEEEEEKSLLTKKLDDTAELIGVLAMRIAGIALVGMALNWVIDQGEDSFSDGKALRDEAIQWIIMAITIVVVAVPEGLPLAVTLALSLSVGRMQEDECLVKRLDATETMGSATCICTDKTGTLTQNRMTVVKSFFFGANAADNTVLTTATETCGAKSKQAIAADSFKQKVCYGICANKAEAEIEFDKVLDRWTQMGNKTDCALLAFSHDMGYDYKVLDFSMSMAKKIYPFSSMRKRAGIVMPHPSGSGFRVYVKGASEMILSLCSKKCDSSSDAEQEFTEQEKREVITKVVTPFAKQSLRTIGLAYRDVSAGESPDWDAVLSAEDASRITGQAAECPVFETELTFLGLVGIEDPLRPTVEPAIRKCNSAGVDVRMVTGDNIDTAVAISKQCGILRPGIDIDASSGEVLNNAALSGPEFRKRVVDSNGKINQEEFDKIWPTLRVLARSSPTDKYLLVSGIIESDLFKNRKICEETKIYPDRQVVAVTGDGTNDAPALKRADVGFVMGLSGTSVAKDAADIVITNDDFSSIVEACKWGRNVYDCISKFLQFQLTVNIVAVTLACTGSFVDRESPLRAVQMLWVNLIMDSLGALALASEPPVPELLERPPYGRNKPLLSFQMKFNMFGQAIYQLIVLFVLLYAGAGAEKGDKKPAEGQARRFFMPSEVDNSGSDYDVWHCDAREYKQEYYQKAFPTQSASSPQTDAQIDAALAPYGGLCSNCGGFLDIPNGRGLDFKGPPCQHYTIIFNAFVMMQLFNWINCRKIYHEFNVFSGIQDNKTFIGIWLICFTIQCLLVEGGAIGKSGIDLACDAHNRAFSATHLSGSQWVLCLVCGVFSLAWQWVLILIARKFFPDMEKIDVYALAGHWEDGEEEKEGDEKNDEKLFESQHNKIPANNSDAKYTKGVHPNTLATEMESPV
ncbi:unnamed protein product [Amoebophrya sp. A120]|nr:unnamed protein product [Amoebophrya sp. A120]|eukprot:GSA120T00019394001.1